MPLTPLSLMYSAASGLLARQFEIDVLADNLANLNTVGFKPARVDFQERVEPPPEDEELGSYGGAALAVTRRSVSPGALRPGISPLELAIEGEGFFAVRLPEGGAAYTRDGRFLRDGRGALNTLDGYPVVWEGSLPEEADAMHVNPDGSVMAQTGGEWTQVGSLRLVRFANPSGLLNRGGNLLEVSESSGLPEEGAPGANGFGQIISGAIETSATDLGTEMSQLVIAQRAYSLSLKAFQQADDMLSLAIRLRR